jgi:hypothetical protein
VGGGAGSGTRGSPRAAKRGVGVPILSGLERSEAQRRPRQNWGHRSSLTRRRPPRHPWKSVRDFPLWEECCRRPMRLHGKAKQRAGRRACAACERAVVKLQDETRATLSRGPVPGFLTRRRLQCRCPVRGGGPRWRGPRSHSRRTCGVCSPCRTSDKVAQVPSGHTTTSSISNAMLRFAIACLLDVERGEEAVSWPGSGQGPPACRWPLCGRRGSRF